jgi:hypothetical protein
MTIKATPMYVYSAINKGLTFEYMGKTYDSLIHVHADGIVFVGYSKSDDRAYISLTETVLALPKQKPSSIKVLAE